MTGPPSENVYGDLTGQILAGRYRILEFVGAGAMGEVWRGKALDGGGERAIKVIHAERSTSPLVVARFKSEAMAASRLEHPNTVRVYDFGDGPNGLLYIAMEFLRGQNLDDLLRRAGRLSEKRTLSIAAQILDAVVAAHQNNVIHRDLKPANVMLVKSAGREQVKVLDFGIAKLLDPLGSEDPTGMLTVTRAGTIVGTPAYMSPEQAAGERVDPRTDIYSVGVTMYHMLTGDKPFRSENLVGLLQQVMAVPPPRLSSRLSTIDPRVEAIVHRAVEKLPEQRFPTARAMRDEIRAVIDSGERVVTLTAAASPAEAGAPRQVRPAHQVPSTGTASIDAGQAAMATMGGQTLTHSTGTFVPSPTTGRRRRLLLGLVVVLGSVVGGLVSHRLLVPGASVAELERRVQVDAWGAAETYALEHFEVFSSDEAAAPLVRQAMQMRRTHYLDIWSERGVRQDPEVVIAPGEWRGEARFPNRPERYRFTFVIESVTAHAVEGYGDWPGLGLRVKLEGYHDGNHLLLWDAGYLIQGRSSMPYNLYDKKSVMLVGDRLIGFDGPYRVVLDGRRVSP